MSIPMKTTIVALLILAGRALYAQTPAEETPLAVLSAEADLVFQGTVTDIAYAASIEGIPHTFVTYRVEDVLKGSYRAPTLTLRFIGGVKIDGNIMRRLSVSHAPHFESGQQDLLMVKDNTQTQCPLVRCAQGRFRFQHGLVTNEAGELLAREPQGGVRTLSRAAEAGSGDSGAGTQAPATPETMATPFDRASFVAHVRQVVAQQGARASSVVRSADPSRPFKGPDPAVSAPPRERRLLPRRGHAGAGSQNEHDRQEVEALIRNGGNPVLPAKDVESLRRLGTAPASAGTPR